MISIVLYGRNDDYGYNLHKRAALSLNCMAAVLADPDDEILFVDYNTSDDRPTFPEAIRDTLTAEARRRLRVFRVRSRVHGRFRKKTHLSVLEGVARNVAIRRSSGANRWILSTNTDMIFVPLKAQSLTQVVAPLPRGLYHAPRIEVPEALWESLDRIDAAAAIAAVRDWGARLHLNEIVRTDTVLYDGPGDFQLMDRADLLAQRGFDESMLSAWHLDSNIARRLALLYGGIGDLGPDIFGYHCDHTRQITPAHAYPRRENSWSVFVENVNRPDVPEQAETWGCAGEDIEELSLREASSTVYLAALRSAIGAPLEKPIITDYTREQYNRTDYDARHVLPFLTDLFANAEKGIQVGWLGRRVGTLALFAAAWGKLGFFRPIAVADDDLVRASGNAPVCRIADHAFADCDALVFDLGDEPLGRRGDALSPLRLRFMQIVAAERRRIGEGLPPRLIVCINAVNNGIEPRVFEHIAAGLTPFSARLRHGFVRPALFDQNWTALAQAGPAGIRDGEVIRCTGMPGLVCYGPRRNLFPGSYVLRVELAADADQVPETDATPVATIELLGSGAYAAHKVITAADVAAGNASLIFVVSEALSNWDSYVEPRIHSSGAARFVVTRVQCAVSEEKGMSLEQGIDWLDALRAGPGGRRADGGAIDILGPAGELIAYGPFWALPAGRYELGSRLRADTADDAPVLAIEVVSRHRHRAFEVMHAASPAVRFEVHENEDGQDGTLPVELRLKAMDAGGRIEELKLRRLGEPVGESPWIASPALREDWLRFLLVGPEGRRSNGVLESVGNGLGLVAYGPYWELDPGQYEARFAVRAATPAVPSAEPLGWVDVAVAGVPIVARNIDPKPEEPLVLRFMLEQRSLIETRLWTNGRAFTVETVHVQQAA